MRRTFGATAEAAAAGFRLPLTETGLGMAVVRRRAGAVDDVFRLGVAAVFVVAEAALRRPRTAVDALFGVDEVARRRPGAAVAVVVRRAVVARPAAMVVVRRARPRAGTAEDAALREAAFALAFTSWASSFAVLATSRSFWRRS
jgi:hypothetical protein